MKEVLIPTLVARLSCASATLSGLSKRIGFSFRPKKQSNQVPPQPPPLDMGIFNCRVRAAGRQNEGRTEDTFVVEICGTIRAPNDGHNVSVKISIDDVTGVISQSRPVHSKVRQWQMRDSPAFCYSTDIGKIPQQVTTLTDWTNVARLSIDWLGFPRKGKRDLQFHLSVLSRDNGEELACAACNFSYESLANGYIDLQENAERSKALAVTLAFAVSAADRKMYSREIEIIKRWASSHIDLSKASDQAKDELERELEKTVTFFRQGNQVNVRRICEDIADIAPIAERYDILELCMYVAQADGSACAEELTILKEMAGWLEVDADRFRSMMEKILPVSMHQIKDTEVILGVSCEMDKEESRQQLNKEYAKWNARVTNSDPQIRAQADQMLMMIADARGQYVE